MKKTLTAFLTLLLTVGAGMTAHAQGILWKTLNEEAVSLYGHCRSPNKSSGRIIPTWLRA